MSESPIQRSDLTGKTDCTFRSLLSNRIGLTQNEHAQLCEQELAGLDLKSMDQQPESSIFGSVYKWRHKAADTYKNLELFRIPGI